jgi:hypothetical protein
MNPLHRENAYRAIVDSSQQFVGLEHVSGFNALGPFPYALPPVFGTPVELWSSDAWFQLPQANLIVNPKSDYLTLNSADRNRAKWPSTSNFCIKLIDDEPGQPNGVVGKRYRNVQSVKLLSAVVPNTNDVLDEPYLLLQINEIEGMYDAASRPSQNAFTKLYFKPSFGKFLRLDKGVGDPLTRVYWPTPKAIIDRFTVSVRTYDGEVFDFGTDDDAQINPELQTTFTLEIKDYVPDTKSALGHRNI